VISVARMRTWLKLPDETQDSQIGYLIAAATATLGRELGRYLGPVETTQELRKGPGPLILLSGDPVGSPTDDPAGGVSLVEQRLRVTDAWETVPETDYAVDGRALRHATAWPGCPASVRVTYRRGYEPDQGPLELVDLVRQMVASTWRTRGAEGMKSETIGDYSYTRGDLEAHADWPTVASRWRRPFV